MIITVASFKGGQAKTTSAVHLAAILNEQQPGTILMDGDPNRSATAWSRKQGFPFRVIDENQIARYSRSASNIVIDTMARPNEEELRSLIDGCDLFIIPLTPDFLSLDTFNQFATRLPTLAAGKYRVLITIAPPPPSHAAHELQAELRDKSVPVFETMIRRRVAFQKAALAGAFVNQADDPYAQEGWAEYSEVVAEILRQPTVQQ